MKDFIKARLNRDNFWNLMFWFGMSFGVSLAFAIVLTNPNPSEFPYSCSAVFWLTIIGVPYITKKGAAIKFNEEKKIFLNGENKEIDLKKLPIPFLVVVSTIVASGLTGAILDNLTKNQDNWIIELVSYAAIFSVFFGIPALFFILKNSPISILFNLTYLKQIVRWGGSALGHEYRPMSNSSQFRSTDIVTDPSYKSLSCNIYNSNR